MIPCEHCKFLRTLILENICKRQLLKIEEHLCNRTRLNKYFYSKSKFQLRNKHKWTLKIEKVYKSNNKKKIW